MKTNENHITLKLFGFSCSPEEVTKIIGLKPTKTAFEGQEYHQGSKQNRLRKKWQHSYWEYRIIKNEKQWISDSVDEFIEEIICPRIGVLKELISKCEAELSIVQYLNAGCNPGLHFSKEIINFLSQIGVDLDVDIYCLAEE